MSGIGSGSGPSATNLDIMTDLMPKRVRELVSHTRQSVSKASCEERIERTSQALVLGDHSYMPRVIQESVKAFRVGEHQTLEQCSGFSQAPYNCIKTTLLATRLCIKYPQLPVYSLDASSFLATGLMAPDSTSLSIDRLDAALAYFKSMADRVFRYTEKTHFDFAFLITPIDHCFSAYIRYYKTPDKKPTALVFDSTEINLPTLCSSTLCEKLMDAPHDMDVYFSLQILQNDMSSCHLFAAQFIDDIAKGVFRHRAYMPDGSADAVAYITQTTKKGADDLYDYKTFTLPPHFWQGVQSYATNGFASTELKSVLARLSNNQKFKDGSHIRDMALRFKDKTSALAINHRMQYLSLKSWLYSTAILSQDKHALEEGFAHQDLRAYKHSQQHLAHTHELLCFLEQHLTKEPSHKAAYLKLFKEWCTACTLNLDDVCALIHDIVGDDAIASSIAYVKVQERPITALEALCCALTDRDSAILISAQDVEQYIVSRDIARLISLAAHHSDPHCFDHLINALFATEKAIDWAHLLAPFNSNKALCMKEEQRLERLAQLHMKLACLSDAQVRHLKAVTLSDWIPSGTPSTYFERNHPMAKNFFQKMLGKTRCELWYQYFLATETWNLTGLAQFINKIAIPESESFDIGVVEDLKAMLEERSPFLPALVYIFNQNTLLQHTVLTSEHPEPSHSKNPYPWLKERLKLNGVIDSAAVTLCCAKSTTLAIYKLLEASFFEIDLHELFLKYLSEAQQQALLQGLFKCLGTFALRQDYLIRNIQTYLHAIYTRRPEWISACDIRPNAKKQIITHGLLLAEGMALMKPGEKETHSKPPAVSTAIYHKRVRTTGPTEPKTNPKLEASV